MKFFKTKAVAALSIALLLSTQTKGMGDDFGVDAENMPLTKTEQIKQFAQEAGQKVGQAIKSTYQVATPHAVNALGMAVNTGKSVFNGVAAHPYMAGGLLGAAALTYAKPNFAGKVATVAIPAGMMAAIAHDNPELVQTGKEAVINASKAVANFATTNAPVVYNAVTNNVVADVIKNNPEYVIPGLIAGAFATYYGYTPVKRGVVKVAGKVAQAAKTAAPYAVKTAAVVAPVAAAAATVKYAPEAVEAAKDAVINAGQTVINAGVNAYKVAVDAGSVAVNTIAEHTPEIVKENSELIIPSVAVGGFIAHKSAGAVKNGAIKAGQAVANNAGKIAVAGMAAGTAAVIAYDNQEVIAAMAKDAVAAVKNADYAQYSQKAVNAVKPVGKLAAKQAAKFKVAAAGMVKAVHDFDYKKMAENAGKWLAQKGQIVSTQMPAVNVNSTAAIASASAVGVAATGYGVYETAKIMNANSDQANRLPETTNELINVDSITVPVTEGGSQNQEPVILQSYVPDIHAPAKKKVVLVPVTKPAPARPKGTSKQELPVIVEEQNTLLQVVLPGQDKAPVLNVYQASARNEVSSSVQEAVAKIVEPIVNRPVAQNVNNIATMASVFNNSELTHEQVIELAKEVQRFALTGAQRVEIGKYIDQLSKGEGNLKAIETRLNSVRRIANLKAAAQAKAQSK
ncbi:MAG: hypothetical protein AMXMBFR12_07080 [Candidatus Babeliales bacterium]